MAKEEVARATVVYNYKAFKDFYIGGAPTELREKYVVINFPLNYCML